MNYLVIEIQQTNGVVGNFVFAYSDLAQAESKYHAILSVAATSSVHVHTAVLMNETGYMIKHESYDHTPAPIPPEPEEPTEGGEE